MVAAAVGFQCPACVREGHREAGKLTRGRRVRHQARVGAAAVLTVAVLAAVAWLVHGYLPARQDTSAARYPRISHPPGVYATSSASAAPTGPFEGTPAGAYPKGEDGLAMPEAVAVDGWSRNEVADALGKVRQLLIGVYLDRRALVDHDPAGILPLLAPSAREYVAKVYREPDQLSGLLISKKARLADEPPRVKGRTTVRTATDDERHPLELITNFVVAYAFDVPNRGPGSRLALSHFEFTWRFYRPDDVRPADRGLLLYKSSGYAFNVDCAEIAKGLLAPPTGVGTGIGAAAGAQDDPGSYYDPDRSLQIQDTCGTPAAPSSSNSGFR
jgi:hypothetical protein